MPVRGEGCWREGGEDGDEEGMAQGAAGGEVTVPAQHPKPRRLGKPRGCGDPHKFGEPCTPAGDVALSCRPSGGVAPTGSAVEELRGQQVNPALGLWLRDQNCALLTLPEQGTC